MEGTRQRLENGEASFRKREAGVVIVSEEIELQASVPIASSHRPGQRSLIRFLSIGCQGS